MPNWCATNWVVKGKAKTIDGIVNKFNKAISGPSIGESDFGPNWLGNLFALLKGGTYDEISYSSENVRGVVDPNPDACACLIMSEPDENERFASEDAGNGEKVFRFSTQSAWGVPTWISDWFSGLWDDLDFGYRATDEFGNFHAVCNPMLVEWIYEVDHEDGDWFRLGNEEELAGCVSKITGLTFDMERIRNRDFSEIIEKVEAWNAEHEDEECFVNIYTEEN